MPSTSYAAAIRQGIYEAQKVLDKYGFYETVRGLDSIDADHVDALEENERFDRNARCPALHAEEEIEF